MKICQKKKLHRVAALLGIMICLTGCTNPKSTLATQGSESLPATNPAPQSETQAENSIHQEPSGSTEPTRIVETVDENFHIDAAVVGYPADGMAGVYAGSPKVFTKEEIEAFVNHCGSSIASVKEWDDGDMIYYHGECANGCIFHYAHGLTQHPYAYVSYRDPVRSELWREYPIYRGEDSYLSNADNMVGWMFTEPREFSFATETQAELAVREALGILGLTDLTLLRTLYIDHNIMAEAGELLATEERFAPIIGGSGKNGYTLRDNWSEDDDAYLFSFGLSVSGIPMSYLYDDSDSTATYTNSEVIVWYTKDGISYLYIDTPWTIGQEESPAQPVVSPYAAMETVKEKYAYDLVREDMQIEELRLMYRYTQDRNRWLLRPVWVARLSYNSVRLDARLFENTYIDAFTGMEW